MKSELKEILCDNIRKATSFSCTNEICLRLDKNERNLKSHLNKKEKKLLLRIIDDKDLIKEEISSHSFIEGFKLGLKLGYESNKD